MNRSGWSLARAAVVYVMLIDAPAWCASSTVSTNDAILSGSDSSISWKKMLMSCGSRAFTFSSKPARDPGGAAVIFA